MKKFIIACLFLSSLSFVAAAQDTAPRELTPTELAATTTTATNNANMLQTTLTLTPAQHTDVYNAELRYQKQFDRYTANGTPPSSGQLGNITAERRLRMKEVLSASQYATYITLHY